MSNFVHTPKFVVSYPSIFEPKKNDLNGKLEYSLVALFPKSADFSKLQAAAQAAMEKKWGADKSKWPTNIRSPFRDQGEKAKNIDGKKVLPQGHVEGAKFMTLKSNERPGVVDKNVQPILDKSQFYAGCIAIATVVPVAYDQRGNRGIAFYLQNIQKVGDGEPLSGRTKAEDSFAPVADEGDGTAAGLFQ